MAELKRSRAEWFIARRIKYDNARSLNAPGVAVEKRRRVVFGYLTIGKFAFFHAPKPPTRFLTLVKPSNCKVDIAITPR